jgi:preprotein translocase subunit SecE
VADKDEIDSTHESDDPAADPSEARAGGSHALEPAEPAVAGVPADADEPTFRDRERLATEGSDADDTAADEPDLDADGAGELVTVGAAPRTKRAGEPASGSTVVGKGRDKKDRATPRQRQVADKERRTGPVTFVKESVSELQKVVYPTGQQLMNYFIVVLIFVLFIIAIVSALDLAFGKAIIAIFS